MPPALTAITLLTLVTFGYVGVCAAVPFRNCRRCRGLGFALTHTRTGKPKRGRACRRCRATGKRLRAGRWLYNRWHRIHHHGTRQPRT
ncbi:hypothetical protein QNO07_16110 [Streptomyces sp. 549]|uniref:hypothetical protein n=1 Tax=Streptomyces sp. 549 TaxID=3049076 RepID=UPI0024C4365F|nr:hypothetical protein [Streptomyces sp. 549]MDK1474928.1 hypothetical protein [Streptomyces sp. 549]